jgi:hypothetical protein
MIQRRLNAATPWHVRVRVSSNSEGEVAVTVTSLRWVSRATSRSRYDNDSGEIERCLRDILNTVQWFNINNSGAAWPDGTRLPSLTEASASQWVESAPQPRIALDGERAELGWTQHGRLVLSLGTITLT